MGYTTNFKGELMFTEDLTASQLAHLKTFLGEDFREHPEWISSPKDAYYIQFELTNDFSGIRWDGSEKFYESTGCVNFLIENMRLKFPNFGFVGHLEAQGEDYEDRWYLKMINGVATKVDCPKIGDLIECPHCCEKFRIHEERVV